MDCIKVKEISTSIHKYRQKVGFQLYDQYCCSLIENSNKFGISRKAKYLSRFIFDLLIAVNNQGEGQILKKAALMSFVYGFQIDRRMGIDAELEKHQFIEELVSNYSLEGEMKSFQMTLMGKCQLESHQFLLKQLIQGITAQDILKTFNLSQFMEDNGNNFIRGMQEMLDLALTHPEFLKFSGEEVFMGSMEAFLQQNCPSNSFIKAKMGLIMPTCSLQGRQIKKYLQTYLNEEQP